MSECYSCDSIIGPFDDHAVTLCGECYHALLRQKDKLEQELKEYRRKDAVMQQAVNFRDMNKPFPDAAFQFWAACGTPYRERELWLFSGRDGWAVE